MLLAYLPAHYPISPVHAGFGPRSPFSSSYSTFSAASEDDHSTRKLDDDDDEWERALAEGRRTGGGGGATDEGGYGSEVCSQPHSASAVSSLFDLSLRPLLLLRSCSPRPSLGTEPSSPINGRSTTSLRAPARPISSQAAAVASRALLPRRRPRPTTTLFMPMTWVVATTSAHSRTPRATRPRPSAATSRSTSVGLTEAEDEGTASASMCLLGP
jgi:hypothetical protein